MDKNKGTMSPLDPLRRMDKKGVELIMEAIIFMIFNLAFFVILFIFVSRVGSGIAQYEELYAKQLALILDRIDSSAGNEIYLNVNDGALLSEKKGFTPKINIEGNNVNIQLIQGRGYEYSFFNNLNIKKAEYVVLEEKFEKRRTFHIIVENIEGGLS